MFRFIIGFLFVLFYLICLSPLLLIYKLIGKSNKEKADRLALKTVSWGCRTVFRISGAKLTIIGQENIPKESVLYISNHNSYFDILVNYGYTQRSMGFVAKDSIGKVPLLGTWFKMVNCLAFDRNDVRSGLEMIKNAIKNIENGIDIYIFPEGTRSKDGTLGEFKGGSFKIATKTNCPIVPVAIRGTREVFERQFPKLRPEPVTIWFGEAIPTADLSKDELKHLGDRVRDIVQEMLNELDAQKP